jgi:hypothetical protein
MELCSLQPFYLTMFYYFKKGMLILQSHNVGGCLMSPANICDGG